MEHIKHLFVTHGSPPILDELVKLDMLGLLQPLQILLLNLVQ